jgi:hypothetical protein
MARAQRQIFEKQRESMRQEMEKKYNQEKEEKELIHKDLKFLDSIAPKEHQNDDYQPEDE